MALTGTLKDFGIAEILQLIGTQKKTGLLTVQDGKKQARMEFADGMVVGAGGGVETVSLEERLLRGHALTQEQLDNASKKANETLKTLPAVLVADAIIDEESIKKVIRQYYSEIVYEVFDWKSGTYEFEQKFLQWDKQLVTPIPAESIMMEGLRIVDEGPGVRKVLPNLDDVYTKAEKNYDELKQLDPEAKQLYDMLDGKLTLKDAIIISGQTKFDAMKALAFMRTNRFIVRKKEKPVVDKNTPARPRRLNLPTMIALYVLLAVTVSVLSIKVGYSIWTFATPTMHGDSASAPSHVLEQVRLKRVRGALEVYRLMHGSYPDRLDMLVSEKLIRRGDIKPMGTGLFPYMAINSGNDFLLGDEALAAIAAEESSRN